MKKSKVAEQIYNFICSNYHALQEEYLRIPKKNRLQIPFPAFCVAFWDEIENSKTVTEQIDEVFAKYEVN